MIDVLHNFRIAFIGIARYFDFKAIFSFFFSVVLFLVGTEQVTIIYTLMILVGIDFITGILGAKVQGITITSKRSLRSASKVVVYCLFISAAHLAETIIAGHTYFEQIVSSFLALTEFISIIENIGKMDFAIPQKLLSKLKEYRDTE